MRDRTELVFDIGPGKEGGLLEDFAGSFRSRKALEWAEERLKGLVSQGARKGTGYLIGEKWLATICMRIHALTPASISTCTPERKWA